MFICTSSRPYIISWTITFTTQNVISHVIESDQSVGARYPRQQGTISLIFTVTSTNPLQSTLMMTSANYVLLNNVKVECEDLDNTGHIYYRIHES